MDCFRYTEMKSNFLTSKRLLSIKQETNFSIQEDSVKEKEKKERVVYHQKRLKTTTAVTYVQ